MTTVELAQHLLPVSRMTDLSGDTPARGQEMALIMTRAVQEYFQYAPTAHRRTTLSEYRPAMETVSVTVTQGSPTVDGAPFLSRQRGCSIAFPGGERNEIVGTSSLLREVGIASGTYTCSVYNDAIAFDDFQIDRVITDPEITTGGSEFLLSPWVPVGSRSIYRPTLMDLIAQGSTQPQRRYDTASAPTHYWTEYVGGSIASATDAAFQFRFWPAPVDAYHVTFDAEILPDTYRIGSITSPSSLPVPEGHAQRILVPLARGLLARSPLFDPEKADKRDLLLDLDEARLAAASLPAVFGPSHQTVSVEVGW
jgi:hypothetical protein